MRIPSSVILISRFTPTVDTVSSWTSLRFQSWNQLAPFREVTSLHSRSFNRHSALDPLRSPKDELHSIPITAWSPQLPVPLCVSIMKLFLSLRCCSSCWFLCRCCHSFSRALSPFLYTTCYLTQSNLIQDLLISRSLLLFDFVSSSIP